MGISLINYTLVYHSRTSPTIFNQFDLENTGNVGDFRQIVASSIQACTSTSSHVLASSPRCLRLVKPIGKVMSWPNRKTGAVDIGIMLYKQPLHRGILSRFPAQLVGTGIGFFDSLVINAKLGRAKFMLYHYSSNSCNCKYRTLS